MELKEIVRGKVLEVLKAENLEVVTSRSISKMVNYFVTLVSDHADSRYVGYREGFKDTKVTFDSNLNLIFIEAFGVVLGFNLKGTKLYWNQATPRVKNVIFRYGKIERIIR